VASRALQQPEAIMNSHAAIPLSAKRLDHFIPPSTEGKPNEIAFALRIATPSERDMIGTKMFRMGVVTVDDSLIRATMIDELYNMDWGKGDDAANEAYADEIAGRLESYWVRGQSEEQALFGWSEREVQRIADEQAEGVKREPEPMPTGFIKPRERAEMKLLSDRIARESSRIRDLMAQRLDYAKTNDRLLCRIHIVKIAAPAELADGLPELKFDADGTLSEESLDEIRERIGPEGYRELVLRIDGQYRLAEEERKNSDLPPGKQSPPNGSTEPSGDSASSDGSSTT
jgi:hypothetical protein